MSDIANSLLEAIENISLSNLERSNATLTIEGTIKEIIDSGLKQYQIEYMSNTFDAYAISGTYNVGDVVYILVPEGDFSKEKKILGAVATSTNNIVDEDSSEDYIEISNNLLGEGLSCSLLTWKSSEQELLSDNTLLKTIKRYAEDGHKDFLLSARIKTNIELEQRINGNYGLQLEIPVLVDPGTGEPLDEEHLSSQQSTQIVNLDIYSIQGNPYNLQEFSLQNVNQTLLDGVEIDTSRSISLKGFVKGFQQRESAEDEYDIQIEDISFTAIQVLTEAQRSGYYLSLVADTGNYFVQEGATAKKILPIMKLNGKTTKINDSYYCYWFVKDPSIDTSSQYYNILGGLGQKCLNNKSNVTIDEEGNQSFSWVTNIYSLIVTAEEVSSVLTYKCVLVKNDKSYTATIDMININNNIASDLESEDGITTYGKDMGIVNLVGTLYYPDLSKHNPISVEQSRLSAEGNVLSTDSFQFVKEEYHITTDAEDCYYKQNIKFKASLIDKINTITCTFYQEETNEGILTKKILSEASLNIMTTNMTDNDLVVIQGADVLYKYDSDGNSPFVADYAYAAADVPKIQDITYKIFKPDGSEFTAAEYSYCKVTQEVPVDSLIKVTNDGVRSVNGMQIIVLSGYENESIALTYKIADVYNAKKVDNYIKATIQYKDKTLTAIKNIPFVKEGESGTNGSKYTAVISFKGQGGDAESHRYGETIIGQRTIDGETIDFTTAAKLQLAYIVPRNSSTGKQYYSTYAGELLKEYNNENFAEGFSVSVYCNGTLVSDLDSTNIEQSIFDSMVTNPVLELKEVSSIKIKQNSAIDEETSSSTIVVASIKVGEKSSILDGSAQEVVRAYYPVEVCYIGNLQIVDLTKIVLPYISGGFDKVLYASDGTNPQWDNDNPFEFKDTLDLYLAEGTYRSYDQAVPAKGNLTIRNIDDTTCSVRPVTKFDNTDSSKSLNQIKGIMRVDLGTEEKEFINEKITEANNIKTEAKNNIDELAELLIKEEQESLLKEFSDAISNKADEVIENFEEEDGKLKTFFSTRGKMLIYLKRLLSISKSIDDYIENNSNLKKDPDKADQYDSFFTLVINKRRLLQKLAISGNPTITKVKTDPFYNFKFELKAKTKSSIDDYFNVTGKLTNAIRTTLLNKYKELREVTNAFDNTFKDLVELNDRGNNESTSSEILQNLIKETIELFNNSSIDFSKYEKFNSLVKVSNLVTLYDSIVMRLTLPQDEYSYDSPLTPEEEENKIDALYGDTVYPIYYQYTDIVKMFNEAKALCDEEFIESIIRYVEDTLIPIYDTEITEANTTIAGYEALLAFYQDEPNIIVITKPIIMLYNAYEMSNLSSQDGNKLYIDDNHGEDAQYLLAPQIGAGKKTEDKKFTGVVMGVRTFAIDSTTRANQIGMFAYNEGQQTYFLNAEDGSTIMGKAGGGQIIIDPKTSKGLIYSSTFYKEFGADGKPSNYNKTNESGEGMIVDLTTPEIRFGNGNFKVTSEGNLTAAGGGLIGGWVIGDTELYSNESESEGRITLKAGNKMLKGYPCELADSENTVVTIYQGEDENTFTYIKFDDDKNFYEITSIENKKVIEIKNHNSVTAKEEIDGNYITTHSVVDKYYIDNNNGGSIYSYKHNTLGSTGPGFYLSSDGLSIGSKVKITSKGIAYFGDGAVKGASTNKYQTINGNNGESYIKYGNISSFTEADSADSTNQAVYIGTDGITLGERFSISNQGNIIAYSGKIGGWSLDKNSIYAKDSSGNKITINSNGSIYSGTENNEKQCIKSDGSAYFKSIFQIGADDDSNTQTRDENGYSSFAFGNGSISMGSSLQNTGGFAGGGNAIYSSDNATPLQGTCITQVNTLIANEIQAKVINAGYIKSSELTTAIQDAGQITVSSLIIRQNLRYKTRNWSIKTIQYQNEEFDILVGALAPD